jgi:hypothetical protein
MIFLLPQKLGFSSIVLSNRVRGEAREVGESFAELSFKIISTEAKLEENLRRLSVKETDLKKLEQVKKRSISKLKKSKKLT